MVLPMVFSLLFTRYSFAKIQTLPSKKDVALQLQHGKRASRNAPHYAGLWRDNLTKSCPKTQRISSVGLALRSALIALQQGR